MEAGGSECLEHILEQLPRSGSLRVRQAMVWYKLYFSRNAETFTKHMFRPDFQRTRAICGLKIFTSYGFYDNRTGNRLAPQLPGLLVNTPGQSAPH